MMGPGQPLYLVLYAVLIFFFTFFYSQATFNPMDVAKNMQQNGGFIPGIRAGKPTSDHLHKILVRITLFGALFLAVVATVPTALSAVAGVATAEKLGFPAHSICIEKPVVSEVKNADGSKGQAIIGGGARFRGRAAEKLIEGLPRRDKSEFNRMSR